MHRTSKHQGHLQPPTSPISSDTASSGNNKISDEIPSRPHMLERSKEIKFVNEHYYQTPKEKHEDLSTVKEAKLVAETKGAYKYKNGQRKAKSQFSDSSYESLEENEQAVDKARNYNFDIVGNSSGVKSSIVGSDEQGLNDNKSNYVSRTADRNETEFDVVKSSYYGHGLKKQQPVDKNFVANPHRGQRGVAGVGRGSRRGNTEKSQV